MKYDKETFELLNLIDAYVTWGYLYHFNCNYLDTSARRTFLI